MLGRALVRAFESEEVTAWDREHLDITDERAVAEQVLMLEPELVLNAAAYTNVDNAEEEPDEADAVNGYAVGNLAVTCAEAEIPLLHVSTDYVFDGTRAEGYTEDMDPAQPVNAYGRSKLLGETLLKENGGPYWLVRTSWLYGPHGEHVIDRLLRAAEGKASLPVVSDHVSVPTYVHDLAGAIRTLVRSRVGHGIYHLVNSGSASRADLAEEVFRDFGRSVRVERVSEDMFPTKAARPHWSILRNTKRPPLRSWQEALKEYCSLRHGT
jgi:dTDP-4-dehydrorhamnose reductase